MPTSLVPLQTYNISEGGCVHADDQSLGAQISSAIDKEDCAYCSNTHVHGLGVFICLTCKECLCYEHIAKHRELFGNEGHHLYCKYFKLPDTVKDGEALAADGEETPFVNATGDVNEIGLGEAPAFDSRCVCVSCQVIFADPNAIGQHASQAFKAVVHATPKAAVAGANTAPGGSDADDPYRNSVVCRHITGMQQEVSPFSATNPIPSDPATLKCTQCPCAKNNWICMTCGAVGCPRKESGGNEHAVAHYKATGHPVVLKLGTVTAKGADMYCYACDDEVKDPQLRDRLRHFGIDMMTAVKTSKSLGEMMYDMTMAADFSSICEVGADGKSLVQPVAGRTGGFMGLHNFGNTCYMNSVVQLLLRSEPFQKAFLSKLLPTEAELVSAREGHTAACTSKSPRTCFECQWLKVATSIYSLMYADTLSGHRAKGNDGIASAFCSLEVISEEEEKAAIYSDYLANVKPADPEAKMDRSLLPRRSHHSLAVLNGSTPRDFKILNARGNKEFLSGQQQDALEYFCHLSEGLTRELAKRGSNPMASFALETVNKKQCVLCQRVKYQRTREEVLRLPTPMHSEEYVQMAAKFAAAASEKDAANKLADPSAKATPQERPRVPLSSLLEAYVAPKMTECRCESCNETDGGYFCSSNLYNFPDYLIMAIPREYIDPTTYQTKKMDVYVDVPEVVDLAMLRGPGALQQGEEPLASHKENEVLRGALQFSDGNEAAAAPEAPKVEVDELALVPLLSMGIEQPNAEWALRECKNDVERAIDFVFSHPEGPPSAAPVAAPQPAASTSNALSPLTDASDKTKYEVIAMVSHIGASAVTGHYVCHLKREDGEWYLFNDEKVGKSVKTPMDLGTFYLLKRL
eukprot:GILI01010927.1.p1 GENE.GILI01010927.1~~GILI01010927.1.p1  ORF type:complete len:877 (+),score=203.72 GILI01010927.1:48-2633(+)